MDLAMIVGPSGRVVGTDIDETKLEICRAEGRERGIENVEFRAANASFEEAPPEFDVAYARFLLTHLSDPMTALRHMTAGLMPDGLIIVEDIDFSGSFCQPMHPAYQRFVELYTAAVQRRGGDPNIGPRLPRMLADAGCERVEMSVVYPVAAMSGEAKLIGPLTMESIADAVLAEGLTDREEIDSAVASLYEIARDDCTVMGGPRVVQAWGRVKGRIASNG